MRFSGVSALAIWQAATRTLTGFGTTAIQYQSNVNASLAANATATFNPSAGHGQGFSMGAVADASGTVTIQLTDGTNTWTAVTIAAGTTGGQDNAWAVTAVFWQIHNNSATVAAHYFAAGVNFGQ